MKTDRYRTVHLERHRKRRPGSSVKISVQAVVPVCASISVRNPWGQGGPACTEIALKMLVERLVPPGVLSAATGSIQDIPVTTSM